VDRQIHINIFFYGFQLQIFSDPLSARSRRTHAEGRYSIVAVDYGDTFFSLSTDTACSDLHGIIGIVGYFTVPSVANYIVHAGGGKQYRHGRRHAPPPNRRTAATASPNGAGIGCRFIWNAAGSMSQSIVFQRQSSSGYFKEGDNNNNYMKDKLSGK